MADTALNRLFYLAHRAQPSPAALRSAVMVEAGSRKGARPGFALSAPRTVFDIERDAEVAAILREYEAFRADAVVYIADARRVDKQRIKVLSVVCFALACGLTFSLLSNRRPAVRYSAPSSVVINTTVPTASQPAITVKAAPEPVPEVAPAKPAASIVTETSSGAPLPVGLLPGRVGTVTVASVSTGAGAGRGFISPDTASPAMFEDEKLPSKPPTVVKATETGSLAKPILKKLESIFSFEQPVVPVPEVKRQPEPAPKPLAVENPEVEKKKEPTPTLSAPALRKEAFGPSGVITLTAGGVVVFDKETKKHRMVAIGAKLPDGSTLKSVDTKLNRISTDKGEIAFE